MARMPSAPPTFDEDFALAHCLADAAAEVTLSFWRRDPQRWNKADGSLATEADLATEDRLRAILGAARPADAILGEERGASGSGSRRWILDGIDGTVAFAAGTEDWGTLIALEVDGEVVLGLCVEPARRRRTWAARGGGAFRRDDGAEPRRLSVSGGNSLAQARTYLPPAHYIPDAAAAQMADTVRARTATAAGFPYHPALEVAAGQAEVAVLFTGGVWDIAAPALIVTEAGGRFTTIIGDTRLDAGSAVYTNGLLHDDVLRVLAPIAVATKRG
ncbi:MAG: inositol monophosphatase family protein [Vicinamibacterales bacterium]